MMNDGRTVMDSGDCSNDTVPLSKNFNEYEQITKNPQQFNSVAIRGGTITVFNISNHSLRLSHGIGDSVYPT